MKEIQLLDSNYTEYLKIKLTANFQEQVWRETGQINNEVTRHRSYLNLLVRKAFLSWLSATLDQEIADTIPLENNVSIWEFVNGNALNINSSRIVLIPTEADDKSEISIPEEWLKIPDWVGNYYLAVEVNLDEEYLCFWGYARYEEVIKNSHLDIINYHRDLDGELLENDLNLIALEYEYGWEQVPQIEPLTLISQQQKYQLITQLKDESFPRYCLDFYQWLSIVSDNEIRHSLFNSRQPIRLSEWLNQQIESTIIQGWQKVNNAIDNLFSSDLSLQPSFSARRRRVSLSEALEILQQNQDQEAINEVLATIPSLAQSDREEEIINALAHLITNHDNEEIRWNGALCLEKLSDDHSLCPRWLGKEINLDDYSVGLLIGLLPKNNQRISIFVRVYELENNSYLPNNLKLQIIDKNNEIFDEVISSEYDSIIQYKFWGNREEKFQIKLIVDDIYSNEMFIV